MMSAEQWDQVLHEIRARDAVRRTEGKRLCVNIHVGANQILSDVLQSLIIDAGCFIMDDSNTSTTWYIPAERVTAVTTEPMTTRKA